MSENSIIWDWLRQVKMARKRPSYDYLFDELRSMPEERSAIIGCAYRDLMRGCNKAVVWQVGSLLIGEPLGDDGFEYFRSWVIWNGLVVYNAVTDGGDDILDCKVDMFNPSCEALGACMEFVPSSEKKLRLLNEGFRSGDWDWQIALKEMERNLPRLWKIYGMQFRAQVDPNDSEKFLDVPGLGVLRVGDRVIHKMGYGEGTIIEILSAETGLAKIRFSAETKPFRITGEYFHRSQ